MISGVGQNSQSEITRADFSHLSDSEWSALERMALTLGSVVVTNILTTSPSDQRVDALGYMNQELEN